MFTLSVMYSKKNEFESGHSFIRLQKTCKNHWRDDRKGKRNEATGDSPIRAASVQWIYGQIFLSLTWRWAHEEAKVITFAYTVHTITGQHTLAQRHSFHFRLDSRRNFGHFITPSRCTSNWYTRLWHATSHKIQPFQKIDLKKTGGQIFFKKFANDRQSFHLWQIQFFNLPYLNWERNWF